MVSLLPLSSGYYSLEYESEDVPHVQAAIRFLFGEPQTLDEHVVSATIRIGNAELLHYFEWDERCLISNSPEGSAVLTAIAEKFDQRSPT